MNIEDKINVVKDILKDKKVAIGFSGGADSTLVAYLSSMVAEDTLAVTVDNHLFPKGFVENARDLAKSFKIDHEIIDIDFYGDADFLTNSPSRCHTCRNLMYSQIRQLAAEKGFDFICDGNNISDLVNDRPGILITYENDFKTPLIEAKLTSKEIHEYLDNQDIAYSRSTTCLATRIPTNTQITREKIERIGSCEDYIMERTNCEIVKVRDLEGICIVEVDDIGEILSDNAYNDIDDALKGQGFKKVCLNLSQIDDNDHISIDYHEGSFSYQLPYTIDMEQTRKQIENIISYDEDKITLDRITIYQNGLIEGHDLESHGLAADTFMEILPKIRRNIR